MRFDPQYTSSSVFFLYCTMVGQQTKLSILLLIGFSVGLRSQDTLMSKTLKELDDLSIQALENNDIQKSRIYSNYQINKAKKLGDSLEVAKAFYTYLLSDDLEEGIRYSDSTIAYSKNSTHRAYPTYGYLTKGSKLFDLGRVDEAMENFVIAYDYATKKNHTSHLNSARLEMARAKSYLGQYYEALTLYKEDYQYRLKDSLSENHKSNYVNSLSNLSLGFLQTNSLDSAVYYSKLGLKEAEYGSEQYLKLVGANAEINYYAGSYDKSLDSLIKYLPHYKGNSLANKYYYVGKILMHQKHDSLAVRNFLKTDSIVVTDNDPFPEVKDLYQEMASYYRKHNDVEKEIYYINKYIWADSLLTTYRNILNPLMTLKFDKPQMLAEKQRLIDRAKSKTIWIYSLVALIILAVGIIAWFYFDRIKLQRRTKQLARDGMIPISNEGRKSIDSHNKIPKEISIEIENRLTEFEKSDLYKDPALNLPGLAKKLDTNNSYLSAFINENKGMNFPSYLKELRIGKAVYRLKKEPELLKYSVKGISQEFGFVTPEAFSRAFVQFAGVKPSQYVKELMRLKEEK